MATEKIEKLRNDFKEARKNRNSELSSLYSTLLGQFETAKKSENNKDKTDDQVLREVADKMVKNLEDTIASGGSEDKELSAEQEIEYLTEYGTEPLSIEEQHSLVDEVLSENEEVAKEVRDGNDKKVGFLFGQVKKKTDKKVDQELIMDLIKNKAKAV